MPNTTAAADTGINVTRKQNQCSHRLERPNTRERRAHQLYFLEWTDASMYGHVLRGGLGWFGGRGGGLLWWHQSKMLPLEKPQSFIVGGACFISLQETGIHTCSIHDYIPVLAARYLISNRHMRGRGALFNPKRFMRLQTKAQMFCVTQRVQQCRTLRQNVHLCRKGILTFVVSRQQYEYVDHFSVKTTFASCRHRLPYPNQPIEQDPQIRCLTTPET